MADSHHEEIARLETLYASNPGGRVFTHLAEAYRKAGRLDRAREIAQDGLRRHDDYASAHVVHGRILLDMGRRDDAAAEFRRVLELDPENRIALRGLGDYERDRGASDEALRHYRQLEQLDPSDEELAAAIAALQTPASPAPAAPPPLSPSNADFFESYSPDPFAGQIFGDAAAGPPAQPEESVESGSAGSGPVDFEPLPLSMDWGGAGGSDAQDLRLDWDLDGAADAPAASPLSSEPESAPASELGDAFRLDVPSVGEAVGEEPAAMRDAAAEWRELEEAASAALPPADHPALPAPGEPGQPGDAGEVGERGPELPEEAIAAGAEEEAGWDAVTWDWQEPEEAAPEPAAPAEATPAEAAAAQHGSAGAIDEWAEAADLPAGAEMEVYTETLAELYRAQGFRERAIEVYRALVADRPGDQRLLMKLRELEGVEVAEAPVTPHAPSWQELADDMEHGAAAAFDEEAGPGPGEPAVAAPEPWHAEVEEPQRRAAEAAGDVAAEAPAAYAAADDSVAAGETERPEPEWVEEVESVWTGGEGAVTIAEGLYVPPPEDGDGAPSGQPLSRWLDALLAWRPTRRPDGDPEEELLLLDEVVEDVEEVDVVGVADAEEGVPDWDAGGGWDDGERGAALEAPGGAAAAAPDRAGTPTWETDRAEPDPWVDAAPDPQTDAPHEATGPRTFEESSLPEPPPPWEQRPDAAELGGGGEKGAGVDSAERLPWEAESGERGSDVADAPGPGGVGNPFETQPGGGSGGSGEDGSEESDDDDLEMFRSWLQSLRR